MVNQQFSMASTAYAAGSTAYHEGRIGLESWHLYEKLVFWAGERGYCWHKIATLAETFGRSTRHVGRWLKELVSAGLIRRVRRSHTSSETHITALADQPSFFDTSMSDHDQTPMSDHTIKSKSLNGGGEACLPDTIVTEAETLPSPSPTPPASPAVAELRAAGLVDHATVEELAALPRETIKRVVAYVQSQRRGGPGLIAWLLRHDVAIPAAVDPPPANAPRHAPPVDEFRTVRRRLVRRPDGTCFTEVIDDAATP